MRLTLPACVLLACVLMTLSGCATSSGGTLENFNELQTQVGRRITIEGRAVNSTFGPILVCKTFHAHAGYYTQDGAARTDPWPLEVVNKTVRASGVLESGKVAIEDNPYTLRDVTWSGVSGPHLPTKLYITWPRPMGEAP